MWLYKRLYYISAGVKRIFISVSIVGCVYARVSRRSVSCNTTNLACQIHRFERKAVGNKERFVARQKWKGG